MPKLTLSLRQQTRPPKNSGKSGISGLPLFSIREHLRVKNDSKPKSALDGGNGNIAEI
ncbi:hypothetical protein [Fontibacillus phaseoli]|uniref:hypothetical protein n=1 Tax=Fontibacillus phaseoli TaxID=1416533 RepID=UPI0015F10EAB|nr:hypothetical protein [Fontibacillus phaseoli]